MLLESVPPADAAVTAPARLVLRFDSRVEAHLSSVVLIGGARQTRVLLTLPGAPGSDTLVYPLPGLPPGQYRAEWKVLSPDGRPTEGVVRFTVLEAAR
jgi:methionine-rich copper-binding protein CopC